mgnify:FL=1|jgi:hypothetical protein|tara:strand:+ start:514 stop:753 length:240 start_codon:yes stop_codon:yes gene_type:complete
MIKMKKLLFNEQNDKSQYEMIMGVIEQFLELRDDFDLRMNKIEKMLNKMKPKLDTEPQRLDPNKFSSDDYMIDDDEDDY